MKIHPIVNHSKYTFKSKKYEDDGILGYDDSVSKQSRDAIRQWRDVYYTPYNSIYEKECNLSEYQIQQLLGKLMNKPKKVDYKKVTGIEAYNVRSISGSNSTCYRGSTLVHNQRALKTLKDAGIERVIDLVGYGEYGKRSREAGLDYYCPRFACTELGVWDEEVFETKEDLIKRETSFYTPLDLEKNKQYLQNRIEAFDKQLRASVDRFVEYINVMQKGYYYIGCEFGTYRTDDFLLLNYVFNPKANIEGVPCSDLFKLDLMKNLYDNLAPEDKKRMGWTKEFDKNVLRRFNDKRLELISSGSEWACF